MLALLKCHKSFQQRDIKRNSRESCSRCQKEAAKIVAGRSGFQYCTVLGEDREHGGKGADVASRNSARQVPCYLYLKTPKPTAKALGRILPCRR